MLRFTWSLRLRPVCSFFPASPAISVKRRSFAVWMSSSPSCQRTHRANGARVFHESKKILKPDWWKNGPIRFVPVSISIFWYFSFYGRVESLESPTKSIEPSTASFITKGWDRWRACPRLSRLIRSCRDGCNRKAETEGGGWKILDEAEKRRKRSIIYMTKCVGHL